MIRVSRTRIKICGVTHPEDARQAAYMGADAVGMIFHPASRRNIALSVALQIVGVLPPFVTPVGLFVDAEPYAIIQVARDLHLTHVQLHGQESPDDVATLTGLKVIKAIRVEAANFSKTLDLWRDAIRRGVLSNLVGIVLETATTDGLAGGTGVPNDWDVVASHQAIGAFEGLPPLIAAGGLRADSVADVIRRIHPWAVDVSSGVEEILGRKSTRIMNEFIAAARSAKSPV